MNLTQRKKEDLRLVFNALETLVQKTGYDISKPGMSAIKYAEDIQQVAAEIFAVWANEDLSKVLSEKEKQRY